MTQLQESISKCRVEGNILFLPTEMLSNYAELKKAMQNAGATYKKNSFVFPNAAQPYIDKLMNGNSVNIKKEFQFFATPASLAKEMVMYADIRSTDIVLEPSAGQGAIIKAIHAAHPGKRVNYYELMEVNRSVLSDMPNTWYCGSDFLQATDQQFDKIIANPPFSKNQDIDHIYKMWEVLKPGGKIVTVASKHWLYVSNKKEVQFKSWIYDTVEADVNTIEAGAFEESGTKIETVLIEINKPH